MYVSYQMQQYDTAHRLKSRLGPYESRSFVKAFLQMLFCSMSNVNQDIIDITNTSIPFGSGNSAAYAEGGVGHPGLSSINDCNYVDFPQRFSGTNQISSDECGIIVGTSTTAVAVGDDNLVSPIAHGSGAGQFIYYGCWGLNYTTGASSASFDIERIFRNDSGGTITVNEIGIYAATNFANAYSSGVALCILRDVLGAGVAVLNGEYLKVKYTITVSN